MLWMARAYVECYNPDVKLSQKQLIKMVHQIQPNEPLPKKIDSYDINPLQWFFRTRYYFYFLQTGRLTMKIQAHKDKNKKITKKLLKIGAEWLKKIRKKRKNKNTDQY